MWHTHPQQQQRGIQLAPTPRSDARRPGLTGAADSRTLCDMTGARQEGFARPRVDLPAVAAAGDKSPAGVAAR
ncbi:hypothetical protein [Tsuneonella sp. HG222]